jgi:hypothetical protein
MASSKKRSKSKKDYGYLTKMAEDAGLPYEVLRKRVSRGWSEEEAMSIPLGGKRKDHKIKLKGRPTIQRVVNKLKERLPSEYKIEVVPYLEGFQQIHVYNAEDELVSYAGFAGREELSLWMVDELVLEATTGNPWGTVTGQK